MNTDIRTLSEKELIIRDLYVMSKFYPTKREYDETIKRINSIDYVKMTIFDKERTIHSSEEILDILVRESHFFDDEFNKNEPKITEPNGSNGSILIATACLALLIGSPLFGLSFRGLSYGGNIDIVSMAFGIFLMMLGICLLIIGLCARYEFKKQTAIANKSKHDHKVWEKNQQIIFEERKKVVLEQHNNEYLNYVQLFEKGMNSLSESTQLVTVDMEKLSESIENLKQNSILPIYYLEKEDAVEKMLFLMLNKRADTVKELINLYETEKWQENVLKQLTIQNENLIIQNQATINGLIALDYSTQKIVDDIENMSFTSIGFTI